MDAAVLVLLLLGLIWAAVLIPPWLQSRRDQGPAASMRSFHRQLWYLGKASPVHGFVNGPSGFAGRGRAYPVRGYAGADYVSAHSPYVDAGVYDGDRLARDDGLRVGDGVASYGVAGGYGDHDGLPRSNGLAGGSGPTGGDGVGVVEGIRDGVVRIDRVVRADDDGFNGVGGVGTANGNGNGFDHDSAGGVIGGAVSPPVPSPDVQRRRSLGYQRRRRVLTVLLVIVTATLLPALLFDGSGWWVAQAVANGLLLCYVALLVRRARRLRERQEKIRYLTAFRPPRPAVVVLHGGAAR